jgi:hypothetical protein
VEETHGKEHHLLHFYLTISILATQHMNTKSNRKHLYASPFFSTSVDVAPEVAKLTMPLHT